MGKLREIHDAVLTRLRGGQLTPKRLAASVALGLFVGTQPIYGLHLPICTALSLAFGLDAIVAYLASNVSIPPMIPVLLFLSLQLGSLVLHAHLHHPSLAELEPRALLHSGKMLFVGALLLGASLALLGGSISYFVAKRLMKPRSPSETRFEEARRRTVELYGDETRASYYYVRSKLALDPLTRELFELAERGELRGAVVDAGCGRGQFSLFLAELGAATSIEGFDYDETKVEIAKRAAARGALRANFSTKNLENAGIPGGNCILLLDVLHYLEREAQFAVLERAANAVTPGGTLLLRETNRAKKNGAKLAKFFEHVGTRLGINRGKNLVFVAPSEYSAALATFGLSVVENTGRGTLDNVLLVARREESRVSDA